MFFYLDASAWIKRYVQESGTSWVQGLFERGERIASATLGYVECVAALSRRLPEHERYSIEARLKADWNNMTRIEFSGQVLERAVNLAHSHRLRGADAVHLATAFELYAALTDLGESVLLVASDEELLTAAENLGLQVHRPAEAA